MAARKLLQLYSDPFNGEKSVLGGKQRVKDCSDSCKSSVRKWSMTAWKCLSEETYSKISWLKYIGKD